MADKPTYEELEKRVKELEEESLKLKQVERNLTTFKTAVESSINAIGISDLKGRVIYVNDSCVKMWDYNSKDEILGKFLSEFFEGDGHLKSVEALREKGAVSGEDIGKRKDGSLFFVQFTASMFKDDTGNPSFMFGSFFDITERKQLEKAILESEEKYRHLSEGTFEAVVWHDKGKILEANKQYYELFGYKPEELAERDAILLTSTPDSVKFMREMIRLGQLGPYEVVGMKKEGIEFPMEVRVKMMKFKGKTARMAAIRDLTERKQVEEALRESEKRYRAVVESQTEMICRFLPDGTLTFVNEAYCRYFGKSRKELIGQNFEFLIPEDDRAKVFKNISSLNQNNPVITHEHRVINPNGETCWHKWTNQAIFDDQNKLLEFQSVGLDITERVWAERAMMESKERFRNLTEATSDWIWEVDENAFYTYVSPKVYDILGYREEEILGKTPFDLMPSEEANRVFKIFDMIRATQKPFDCLENTNLHKNGHPVVLETSGIPIFDTDGKFRGYRGVDRDITQRKRAKEELQKAHDELEYRVKERTKELEIQRSNLEEANIALQVLLEKRQEDKKELENNVLTNVKEMTAPYFEKLKKMKLNYQQKTILSIIEFNLNEIVSPFTRKISLKYLNLTPSEIHIANLIRQGINSKEIANLMNLSTQTIYNHRKNIRKKLGLEDKKTNLRSHLLSTY